MLPLASLLERLLRSRPARIAATFGLTLLHSHGLPARGAAAPDTPAPPLRVIFDTDLDSDCDDTGALAVLHTLANRGEVEILATVVSSLYEWNVPCLEVINRYYGRPDLPIGAPKQHGVDSHAGSKYARQIAESAPTKLKRNADAPDALAVYRGILATQPDGAVTILSVGDLTNLRNLLESPGDALSPLPGPELIQKKVRRWICMGGRYPNHLDPHVFGNFKPDAASTVTAVRDWPGEVVFCGLGDNVMTGARLKETPADNPVRRAFELYLGDKPMRPSWDEIATLYAVRPNAKFWKLRTDGSNHIFPNGTNEWRDTPDSPHHELLLFQEGAEDEVRATIDDLMIQPPK